MTDTQICHCFQVTAETIAEAVLDIVKLVRDTPGIEFSLINRAKGSILNEHKKQVRKNFKQLEKY
jgi:hypothetical protein